MKKRLIALVTAMFLLLGLAACTYNTATGSTGQGGAGDAGGGEKVWKFAIVFNGPVNDGGWNQNAWNGLEQLKEAYGDQVEITYAEKVEQADYEDTFYGYAKDGYDMVVANGYEFSDAAMRVAEEFPEVKFAIINGLNYTDNVFALEFDNVELGYICGLAAGAQAREQGTNVGFIGAEEIPSYKNFYAGLTAAVASIAPDAEVKAFYTGDWSDISKATEMANTAISSGYEVLVPWVSAVNHAIYAAAKEQGVTFVQTSMEMDSDEYVDNIIINTDQSNAALVRMAGEACINDSIPEDGRILGNLSNDINIINSWGTTLDDSVKSEVDALYESIRKGEIEMPEKVAE